MYDLVYKRSKWFFIRDSYSEDEPTEIYFNGLKRWIFKMHLHRTTGPAIIFPNGDTQWWIHGKRHHNKNTKNQVKL